MTAKHKIVDKLLQLLQKRLVETGLWQAAQPSPEDLESQEPFCVDTLAYEQWLKFVFIPRMKALLDAKSPLPQACALTPQAEMQFSEAHQARINEVTQAIDQLLTEGKTPPARLLREVS